MKTPQPSDLGNVFNSSMELLAAAIVLLSRTRSVRVESDDDGNVVAIGDRGGRHMPKGLTLVGTYRYASQRYVRNDLIELASELARKESAELDGQAGAIA